MRIALAVIHLLALWGTFGISLVDNILRPILIGDATRLPTLLIFFSILGGLQVFGFLGLVLALEIWPMLTLIGWRRRTVRGGNDPAELARKGPLIARISDVQMLLVVAMVVCAVMMARGYGSQ